MAARYTSWEFKWTIPHVTGLSKVTRMSAMQWVTTRELPLDFIKAVRYTAHRRQVSHFFSIPVFDEGSNSGEIEGGVVCLHASCLWEVWCPRGSSMKHHSWDESKGRHGWCWFRWLSLQLNDTAVVFGKSGYNTNPKKTNPIKQLHSQPPRSSVKLENNPLTFYVFSIWV